MICMKNLETEVDSTEQWMKFFTNKCTYSQEFSICRSASETSLSICHDAVPSNFFNAVFIFKYYL